MLEGTVNSLELLDIMCITCRLHTLSGQHPFLNQTIYLQESEWIFSARQTYRKKKLFRDRLVLFSLSLKEKKKLFVCNHLIFNY